VVIAIPALSSNSVIIIASAHSGPILSFSMLHAKKVGAINIAVNEWGLGIVNNAPTYLKLLLPVLQ
jgi:hypothetical protein